MKGNKKVSKGFTLIELLVVIAIIAILSVVVILTLNPAELLRQSRDSNRISDLSVTKSAIAFYLASVTTPFIGTSTACNVDVQGANGIPNAGSCVSWFPTTVLPVISSTAANATKVDGSGWIRIGFTGITAGGSPLGALPHDPLDNDSVHFYSYIASSTGLVFHLGAVMESQKYGLGGSNDVVNTDGGASSSVYEQGTSLSL